MYARSFYHCHTHSDLRVKHNHVKVRRGRRGIPANFVHAHGKLRIAPTVMRTDDNPLLYGYRYRTAALRQSRLPKGRTLQKPLKQTHCRIPPHGHPPYALLPKPYSTVTTYRNSRRNRSDGETEPGGEPLHERFPTVKIATLLSLQRKTGEEGDGPRTEHPHATCRASARESQPPPAYRCHPCRSHQTCIAGRGTPRPLFHDQRQG